LEEDLVEALVVEEAEDLVSVVAVAEAVDYSVVEVNQKVAGVVGSAAKRVNPAQAQAKRVEVGSAAVKVSPALQQVKLGVHQPKNKEAHLERPVVIISLHSKKDGDLDLRIKHQEKAVDSSRKVRLRQVKRRVRRMLRGKMQRERMQRLGEQL